MNTYTPDSTKVVHYTYADMSERQISRPVHMVQYDNGLPILAVKLYKDGAVYTCPSNAVVNIRLGKEDGTFVYNPALGWDSTRQTVYFEITNQMTVLSGEVHPVVEIEVGASAVASGEVTIIFDRNPVQQMAIESTTEYITAREYATEAVDAAARASSSQTAAANSASAAAKSQTAAANSASQAQAAYKEIIGADVGKFGTQLATEHSVLQPLYDSSGESLLDSSGGNISGRVIFADESEILSLKQTVSNLETFIRDVLSKLMYTTEHALLDDKY